MKSKHGRRLDGISGGIDIITLVYLARRTDTQKESLGLPQSSRTYHSVGNSNLLCNRLTISM